MNKEYKKELQMKYLDLCKYLQKKYGMAFYDYFPNPECNSKNKKVTRTSEGLFCHHIMENIYGNLGNKHIAKVYPFVAQKKENLVYCNFIEHLILHLKINVNACSEFEYPFEIGYFFSSEGFFWILYDINNLYMNNGSEEKWRNNCYEVIKNDYKDYVKILKSTLCFIEDNYIGKKSYDFSLNEIFPYDYFILKKEKNELLREHKCEDRRIYLKVIDIDYKKNIILLRSNDMILPDNELMDLKTCAVMTGFLGCDKRDKALMYFDLSMFLKKFDYEYIFNFNKEKLSLLWNGKKWIELEKEINLSFNEDEKQISKFLKNSIG